MTKRFTARLSVIRSFLVLNYGSGRACMAGRKTGYGAIPYVGFRRLGFSDEFLGSKRPKTLTN